MAEAGLLLVVHKGDASLGFYDPLRGLERERIALDPFPHEFVVSSDQRHAYVAQFGLALAEDSGPGGAAVSVVDLSARRRLQSFDCGAFRRPHGITLDRRGRLYVLSEGASTLLIASDIGSRKFDRALPTAGAGSHIVTATGDGNLAFCSNMGSDSVSAVHAQEPERAPVVLPVGARPEGSVLDPNEEILYVCNRESAAISRIRVRTLEVLEPIRTRPGPVRICWDDRGRLLVPLYHDASLALIDPLAPAEQTHIALPAQPISISFDAITGRAFASTLVDEVCVIDVARRSVVLRIKTGRGPDPTALIRP